MFRGRATAWLVRPSPLLPVAIALSPPFLPKSFRKGHLFVTTMALLLASGALALCSICRLLFSSSLRVVLCAQIRQNVPFSTLSGLGAALSFGLVPLCFFPYTPPSGELLVLLGFASAGNHQFTALALTFPCVFQNSASQGHEAGHSWAELSYQRV